MTLLDNLRQTVYKTAVNIDKKKNAELNVLRETQWMKTVQIRAIQDQRLSDLILDAYQHVPYYKIHFDNLGIVKSGKVFLEHFNDLPVLRKADIRAHYKALTSTRSHELKAFQSRTGGSTGEPLVFLQDIHGVRISGGVLLRFFYEWHNINPGDKEVKLWGSERDLFYRSHFSLRTIHQWMSGTKPLNAFRMSPERMRSYVDIINRYQPKLLRGYSTNLYEFARFIQEDDLKIIPPKTVISSAGTLYTAFREKMASVYNSPIYNHYGSREMHNIAMECPEGHRLHISALTHLVEVLDENNKPCPPGVEGDLVITSLMNRAMPLIRYKIGDRGTLSQGECTCGRGLPSLESLSGRIVDCFRTEDGRIIPGEYFIHLLGVFLNKNLVYKFQVIQDNYHSVRFIMIVDPKFRHTFELERELVEKTKLVMGENVSVDFNYVEDISSTASGKYSYTLCKIPDRSL